ncbi:hypothetical protein VPH35_000476 [Triticum aestivum]
MYYMQKMFIQDIFPSWLYVCCTYMPTSSTGKKISARIKSQTYFSFFRSLSILCPELNSVLFAATAKSSYRWGYRGCQDGQRIGIEFAELARTDHDLVTFAIEGTVYLWSPVDLMTLATATANATDLLKITEAWVDGVLVFSFCFDLVKLATYG